MNIQSFKPQNSILSKLIECVYILEKIEDKQSDSFIILPSISAYFSVSVNTISYLENEKIVVESTSTNPLDSSIQFGLKSSTVYEYRGKIKEICILFKPLAIFDFFAEDLLLKDSSKQLFIPDGDYQANITRILDLTDHAQIIAEIEKYLLGKYTPFAHPYLRQAVAELGITDSEKPIKLEDLSKKFKITRQTLNSQFKKYLNLSASEFRQICRFRKFIQAKLIDKKKSRLTNLAYDFGFFDQSHLIKEFKKYTFLKPNDFFRKLTTSENNQILAIWQ